MLDTSGPSGALRHQKIRQAPPVTPAGDRMVDWSAPPVPVDRVRPESVTIEPGSSIKNAGNIPSTWFVDYDPNDDQTAWDPIFLYAWKPDLKANTNASLSLRFPHDVKKNRLWVSPVDVGEITVTDISALHGVVNFKTSTGKAGMIQSRHRKLVLQLEKEGRLRNRSPFRFSAHD
jgi:hypothetical protein